MKQTATERHLWDGVLDKQVLLYCAKYCCNISLCETWQGIYFMLPRIGTDYNERRHGLSAFWI